jgi:hypothetical protein
LARAVLAAVSIALLAVSGCGSPGVEKGAVVTVYSGAPVCAAARGELGRSGGETDDVRVRAICTKAPERRGRLDLAAIGASARRAVQDSRTVAFLQAPGAGNRFARPILEEAEIGLVADRSGARGMARILAALESRGSGESPREAIWAMR